MERGHVQRGRARAAVVVLALLATLVAVPSASAAQGDFVTQVEAPESTFGVGLAFDGGILYYTNIGEPVLHRVTPAGGPLPSTPIIGTLLAEGVNAIAYDATRDMFWAVGNDTGRTIYLIDKAGIAVLQFVIVDAVHLPGACDNATQEGGPGFCDTLVDGLAYDAGDDSLWFSPDASHRIYHLGTDGAPLGFYDINEPGQDMAPFCGFNYSSGVVVARQDPGTGETIHYNFANGCEFWFQYLSSDLNMPVRQAEFATYTGPRAEDGECDDRTFGFSVVWVRDELDNLLRAFEADCVLGGGVTVRPDKSRMTGGGGLVAVPGGERVHHGFMIHCDRGVKPNRLQVNWGDGNRFHLTELDAAACSDRPLVPNPDSSFDTIEGSGSGRLNGEPGATVEFSFTDAGEPGSSDSGELTVRDQNGVPVLVAGGFLLTGPLLGEGNYQAHDAG